MVAGEKGAREEGWRCLPCVDTRSIQTYLPEFLLGPAVVPLRQVGLAQEAVRLCHLSTEVTKHCHLGSQGLSQDGGRSL